MNEEMCESSCLGDGMSTNICVSMSRNLSISIVIVKLSPCETELDYDCMNECRYTRAVQKVRSLIFRLVF